MYKSCQWVGCENYSDIDAYFDDGSSESLCSDHAHEERPFKRLVQAVPQHGGDMNVSSKKK